MQKPKRLSRRPNRNRVDFPTPDNHQLSGCEKMLDRLKCLQNIALQRIEDCHIILVANIREKTDGFCDYLGGTSVVSEFLTLNQYELIIQTLRNIGFEVSGYFDENTFLQDCIEKNFFKSSGKQIVVINTAQKGTAIGRKSLIPAFCDMNGLWHTNSNAYTVSLTRNKYHCDSILAANHFPVTDEYLYIPQHGWFSDRRPKEGEKIIAKLNGETSSIGLSKENIFNYSKKSDTFINELSELYCQPVLVQRFIEGYEVEVPVINVNHLIEIVLPVGISVYGENHLHETILDYEIRKNLKFDFYDYSQLNDSVSRELEKHTINATRLLGIEGFGRVDFRVDSNGTCFITDVAANPHLTKGMSFNYAFTKNNLNYESMILCLVGSAIARHLPQKLLEAV